MRTLVLCATLFASHGASAQVTFTTVASVNELAFGIQYISRGDGDHRCAPAWFVIEQKRWKCITRSAQGRLEVKSFGWLPNEVAIGSLIRKPIAGDRRLLYAVPLGYLYPIYAFDPVTLQSQLIGSVPNYFYESHRLVDFDGDGTDELMTSHSPGYSNLISLPGGSGPAFQIVGQSPHVPHFAGQFDTDSNDEIGVIGGDRRMTIFDAKTGAQEPLSPTGFHSSAIPVWTGDWDGDGIDEIAAVGAFGGTSLIDFSPTVSQITLAGLPLGLIDWLPRSRDLALWTRDGVAVVDPVTGTSRATFPGSFNPFTPQLPLTLDWDGDGDQDLLWHHDRQPRALWVLQNPAGPAPVQYGAGPKLPIGTVEIDNETRLLSVEAFDQEGSAPLRLRTRNPQSLDLLSDVLLGSGDLTTAKFDVADLHSQPGEELLYNGGGVLALITLQGQVLWQVESVGFRKFASVQVPDFTCSGSACKQILLTDYPFAFPADPTRLRLLDGETGDEIWSRPAGHLHGSAALTDLSGDGVPEILLAAPHLTALHGVTRTVMWEAPLVRNIVRVRRSEDSRRRLAVLTNYGGFSYLDPATGIELRNRKLTPIPFLEDECTDCDMRYLAGTGDTGHWVISHENQASQNIPQTWLLPRNLRGPLVQDSSFIARAISVRAPNRIHVGEDSQALHVFEVPQDSVFEDEFEEW